MSPIFSKLMEGIGWVPGEDAEEKVIDEQLTLSHQSIEESKPDGMIQVNERLSTNQ
jgi:hypothetical protein